MKATGIVRRIDDLGRLVLPIELRRIMGIEEQDPVEVYVDDEYIIVKKYLPTCIFCNSSENIQIYEGRNVCKECLEELSKTLENK